MLHLISKVMTIFNEGQSKQFISTFKITEVNESTEDVDSIFIEISTKIRSRSKDRPIFYEKFRPSLVTKIKSPDIIEKSRYFFLVLTFTTNDNQHFSFVVYASMASSWARFQAICFNLSNIKGWYIV